MQFGAQSVCWTLSLSFSPCTACADWVDFVGHNFLQVFQSAATHNPSTSNQGQLAGKAEKVCLAAKESPKTDGIEVKVMILAPRRARPKSADIGMPYQIAH